MEKKVDLPCNKIPHLENSVLMYGIYNSETLEKLINTVHKMHNTATCNEKLFSGKLAEWYNWYLSKKGICNYAINACIFENNKRKIYSYV